MLIWYIYIDNSQLGGGGGYQHNHVEDENNRSENELADKVKALKSVSSNSANFVITHVHAALSLTKNASQSFIEYSIC